ncbi:MAG: hypothetical protein IPM48_03885 [Saprospiraceae bacterium]|nr:hypothetical protein [Saprospiraceae bacterium]
MTEKKQRDQKEQKVPEAFRELANALIDFITLISSQNLEERDQYIKELALVMKRMAKTPPPSDELVGFREMARMKFKKGAITQWMNSKKFTIAGGSDSLKVDAYLHQVSDYLALHYSELKPFYETLKLAQNRRKDFRFKMQKSSLRYIGEWCKKLSQLELIDRYHFNRDEVVVEIAEIHKATQFIMGYWLEVLLRSKVAELLRKHLQHIQNFDFLSQTGVMRPDGKNTEIDLLLMVNQKFFWFECKSGNIASYYQKFASQREFLGLDPAQSFLVCQEADPNKSLHVMKVSGMNSLYATELVEQLEKYIFEPLLSHTIS